MLGLKLLVAVSVSEVSGLVLSTGPDSVPVSVLKKDVEDAQKYLVKRKQAYDDEMKKHGGHGMLNFNKTVLIMLERAKEDLEEAQRRLEEAEAAHLVKAAQQAVEDAQKYYVKRKREYDAEQKKAKFNKFNFNKTILLLLPRAEDDLKEAQRRLEQVEATAKELGAWKKAKVKAFDDTLIYMPTLPENESIEYTSGLKEVPEEEREDALDAEP